MSNPGYFKITSNAIMNCKKVLIGMVFFCYGVGTFSQIESTDHAKAISLQIPDSKADNTLSKVWIPDDGDGTYKNPILHADYSDPDAIRVGDDYFLVSSSFQCVPGLPILHSKDLVNWSIINHVISQQKPPDVFDKPQIGKGAWAPSIRYYQSEFYVFYPDPDYGIYVAKTKDIFGKWSDPVLIMPGKGLIDPCPLWDDNGEAYLVHGFAGSRAGIKNIIAVCKMSSDATKILDEGTIVFDGHDHHKTVEGPKFYKRNGYYYIMLPAGGVPSGYQLILRSKSIYGPYEEKIVLEQGSTPVNGPHQGAWVETQTGQSWFLHFQDKGAYGRVVHLEPVLWVNDWPVMGSDPDGDGKGEPVLKYKKPNVGKSWPLATPATSDEFSGAKLGLQWQWHANYKNWWAFPIPGKGILRMFTIALPDDYTNLADVPNLLMQKFPAEEFTVTTKATIRFSSGTFNDEEFGLIVMGHDYACVSLKKTDSKLFILRTECINAAKKEPEKETEPIEVQNNIIYFQIRVTKGGICHFSYSSDGSKFTPIGGLFTSKPGGWIGAKVGLYCIRKGYTNDPGFIDVDWFRVE